MPGWTLPWQQPTMQPLPRSRTGGPPASQTCPSFPPGACQLLSGGNWGSPSPREPLPAAQVPCQGLRLWFAWGRVRIGAVCRCAVRQGSCQGSQQQPRTCLDMQVYLDICCYPNLGIWWWTIVLTSNGLPSLACPPRMAPGRICYGWALLAVKVFVLPPASRLEPLLTTRCSGSSV